MTEKWIQPGEDPSDAFALRFEIFCDEQGYTREQEIDEEDKTSPLLVLYDGETPVATGRVVDEGNQAFHIGRICVKKNLRGSGIGRTLVEALLKKAREMGAREITLGAQCRAQGFYEKLGFVPCGEVYMDGHVPHIPMRQKKSSV